MFLIFLMLYPLENLFYFFFLDGQKLFYLYYEIMLAVFFRTIEVS